MGQKAFDGRWKQTDVLYSSVILNINLRKFQPSCYLIIQCRLTSWLDNIYTVVQ